MGHLSGGPNRQFSLEELSYGHMKYKGNGLRHRRPKDIFENKISLAKPLFDIATTQLEMTAEVTPRREILNQFAEHRLLLRPGIVDQWRGGLQRLLFVKNRGQFFVLNFDQRQGLRCDIVVPPFSCGPRLARKSHLVQSPPAPTPE